jgi:hypothetical protein
MGVLLKEERITYPSEVHVPSLSTVSASRTSLGNKLLTSPPDDAIASVAGFNMYLKLVYKCHLL